MNIKNNRCGIYMIKCLENNKIYIGSSNNISARWYSHKYNLKKNEHSNYYLQLDWNLYGSEKFEFTVLEFCDYDIQFEKEQEYLDRYKPFSHNDKGYNILGIATPHNKTGIRIFGGDYDGYAYIKGYGSNIKMHITDYDLHNKSREELAEEYEGYTTMYYLEDDILACNPNYND